MSSRPRLSQSSFFVTPLLAAALVGCSPSTDNAGPAAPPPVASTGDEAASTSQRPSLAAMLVRFEGKSLTAEQAADELVGANVRSLVDTSELGAFRHSEQSYMELTTSEKERFTNEVTRILPFYKGVFRASLAKAKQAAADGDAAAAEQHLKVAEVMSDALRSTNRALIWRSLGESLATVANKTRWEIEKTLAE